MVAESPDLPLSRSAYHRPRRTPDELLLVKDEHVLAISLWKNADAAHRYESTTYPTVDQKFRPMMSGAPTVETFKHDALSTIA